jgi:hypothetical protein
MLRLQEHCSLFLSKIPRRWLEQVQAPGKIAAHPLQGGRMATPAFRRNEPGKPKETAHMRMSESVRARLPHAHQNGSDFGEPPVLPPNTSPEPGPGVWRWNFLPAFWTIASILSMAVNIILIIILLLAWQLLNRMGSVQGVQSTAMNRATDVLGGLYDNFVRMDQANIRTNIHVEKDIPVQFSLQVSGPSNVILSAPVRITGARVWVQTGGLTITNADATILLPQGVVLPINIENLVVPVDQKVPAVLDVPVDIPLSQTELHEPFVGLREVVEPYYCLIQKFNGKQLCPPTADDVQDETPPDPALPGPTPVGTVIP